MVPEAYRQRFRDYRMGENQTYVEFFRQKETYLDRWIAAKGIGTDYDKLRQLILIEEFKWCVHYNLKTFLNERQVDTGYEMATLADEYTLTHQRNQNKSEDPSEYRRSTKPRITTSTSTRARLGQTTYLHRPNSPNNKRPNPHSFIPRHMEGGRNLTCCDLLRVFDWRNYLPIVHPFFYRTLGHSRNFIYIYFFIYYSRYVPVFAVLVKAGS